MTKFSSDGNERVHTPSCEICPVQPFLERFMCQIVLSRLGAALVLSAAGMAAAPALAEVPQRNLLVAWRLQSTDTAMQAERGVRQGEIRVDSRSGMSGQGVLTWSNHHGQDSRQGTLQVMVLNGASARLTLSQQQPSVHWQFLVSDPRSPQVQALGQTVWVTREQGLRVRPVWSGGRSPVRLEFEVQGEVADATQRTRPDDPRPQLQSSAVVLVPLDQWTVVARSGQQAQRQQQGSYASAEASQDGHSTLEIKVSLP
jgi:hypothetical protein